MALIYIRSSGTAVSRQEWTKVCIERASFVALKVLKKIFADNKESENSEVVKMDIIVFVNKFYETEARS